MKNIIKLRLINWHYFTNTTSDVKNITFLTGPNGTGKSTIIDALQIVILGTTRPENFNKAANEKGKSGRNLISYLRGQTGVTNDGQVINLRKGNFTSYVAIEIYDDVNDDTFSVGVVFDVDSSDNIDKHYFYLNAPFPKNNFVSTDTATSKPLQYKELSAFFKANYKVGSFKFFDTDTEYKNFIKVCFGNLPDKYFDLFKKAVAFAPISDIASFITEYICDVDKKVNIEDMQKTIDAYKMLEIEAKNLRTKLETLDKIKEHFDNYQKLQISIQALGYVSARVSYEEQNRLLRKQEENLKKGNDRIAEISRELNDLDNKINDLKKDLDSYNAKKAQSSNYSLTERLNMKKENITAQIDAINSAVNMVMTTLNNYLHDYHDRCLSFVTYYSQFKSQKLGEKVKPEFDRLMDLCREVVAETETLIVEFDNGNTDFAAVKAFRDDMDYLRNQAISLRQTIQNELFSVSANMTQLKGVIETGSKPFETVKGITYTTIKDRLEDELKRRHGDAYLHILCDLVNVNDGEWTMALEAVLFGQKFNFFVNPRYYQEANLILKGLCDEYEYYGVSIVDTEKLLQADIKTDPHSIAELLDTEDAGARVYIDYLLGRIRKCSTFEEARASGSGLLSDCTGYRAYATWYLDKKRARYFFLGTSSNISSDVSSRDYQDAANKVNLYNECLSKLQNLLTISIMSEKECETYKNDIENSNKIAILDKDIQAVDKEMHKAELGDISDINDRIKEINDEISLLERQRDEILTERGRILSELNRLNGEEIPLTSSRLEEYKKALDNYDKELVNTQFEPFFSRLLEEQGLTLAQIRTKSYQEFTQNSNRLRTVKDNLLRLRSDYCNTYHLSYNYTDDSSNAEFEKERENISQVLLPEYEQKIQIAHDNSIKEFKDHFIYQLRSSILTVQEQIDELNDALKDCRFGRDSYEFKVSPSKDYKEYYDMIMDSEMLQTGDAEALFTEKYQNTMENLFNLISSSTSARGDEVEQIKKTIDLFTTYTTYISFDLIVLRGDQRISLDKSFKSQSGGEGQTPFYISILASFASLCRVNNKKDDNTLRFVIFDEAFSKMDASRFKEATSLIKYFGLQVIISTPSEKLGDLISFVDLILVTIKDEKKKHSGLDVYQDKNKNAPLTPPNLEIPNQ